MCENYKLCPQPLEEKSRRPFTFLFLDCWQREYDKRPYRNFCFNLLEFEKRLRRKFHPVYDFLVIVSFIKKRALCTVRLTGIHLLPYEHDMLQSFVESLITVSRIELRLMQLPTRFFELLRDRGARMNFKDLILEG